MHRDQSRTCAPTGYIPLGQRLQIRLHVVIIAVIRRWRSTTHPLTARILVPAFNFSKMSGTLAWDGREHVRVLEPSNGVTALQTILIDRCDVVRDGQMKRKSRELKRLIPNENFPFYYDIKPTVLNVSTRTRDTDAAVCYVSVSKFTNLPAARHPGTASPSMPIGW